MNKEQQELLGKAYNNYFKKATPSTEGVIGSIWVNIAKNIEEFIDKCKTDTEFSERWGIKIEEREFSLEERMDLINKMHLRSYSGWQNWSVEEMEDRMNNDWKIRRASCRERV